jgi:integrase
MNLLEVIGTFKSETIEEVLDLFLNYKRFLDIRITRNGLAMANGSKRIHLSVLKKFFRAQGIRIHHEYVSDHVKIGRRMRVQKFPLDLETVEKIVENIEQFQFKTLTAFLASTGMRVTEAITLQPTDFAFNSDPVSVKISARQTKTS